ncbi:MAG: S9 family peptidase [Firmicutes bacterium]|nr:S9 family peptidase [Dethiobacter sp.]MBS3887868.1 S9 family peptidase [Bacillota bacterium]
MKRPLSETDLLRMQFISSPEMSPCGKTIAFVKTHIEGETMEYRSHIFAVPTGGGDLHQLTAGGKAETAPRFSPCGTKLVFVSDRGVDKQLWLLDLSLGGEARPLTTMRYGATNPVWSPDGQQLVFLSRASGSDDVARLLTPRTQQEKEAEEKNRREEAKVVDKIKYKADEAMGLLDGKHSHVWVVGLEGGTPRRLTEGDFDHHSPSFSPCGSYLAISSNRDSDTEFAPYDSDIYSVTLATGEIKRLTATPGPAADPVWSPDGKHVAYVGHTLEYRFATLNRIYLVSSCGGEPVCVTSGFDRSIGDHTNSDCRYGDGGRSLTFSADGQRLYFMASDRGDTHVYVVRLDTRTVDQVTRGRRHVQGLSFDKNTSVAAMCEATFLQPAEIYVLEADGSERQLTHVNAALLAEISLSEPEEFWYEGVDGWDIQGWLMKPVNFAEGKKYPVVLEIHGGPHTQYGCSFFYEFQLLASNGFGVLFTNPRGSHGYGQTFVDAVRGDYGGNDYGDLMLAVDHVVALPWVDKARLGVTGGSYGGFMTNWIVGHTDRFKGAVTHRSISNWLSFYGVSDIGYTFTEFEINGNPWDDQALLLKRSPISYVKNVKTPTLVLHCEQDMRCPIEQGEQFYVYLKKLGVKTRLVRFPASNHELTRSGKPKLRLENMRHVVGWFLETVM